MALASPHAPADRIQVNIVAGILTLFQAEQPVLSMRAVAGKVGNETPMLQSMVHSVVLNPPWNVPSGIAAKELYPKGAAYLARNGFRTIDGHLQQKAGPKSALGRLKFDFVNPFAVYLHDTPSQMAFSRDERLASHGCVRLQNPRALAKALFKDDPVWTGEAIEDGIAAGDNQARDSAQAGRGLFALLDRLLGRRRPGEFPRRPLWLGRDAAEIDRARARRHGMSTFTARAPEHGQT